MTNFEGLLTGGDLRSIGQSNAVVALVNGQDTFNRLFECLSSTDRKVAMRSADAIEKITLTNPRYLQPHKPALIRLLEEAVNKESKWHLALVVSRLALSTGELDSVWKRLYTWATDKKESRIVRVNALQGLYNLSHQHKDLRPKFWTTISEVDKENIPSIRARIKKFAK